MKGNVFYGLAALKPSVLEAVRHRTQTHQKMVREVAKKITREINQASSEQLLLFPDSEEKSDFKEPYRQIRNYLAGQFIGATRDETLLLEVTKCLFCKIYINKKEIDTDACQEAEIEGIYKSNFIELKDFLPSLFGKDSIFSNKEKINLNAGCLSFIDNRISRLDLQSWNRDPFGDVYEVFVGSSIRGQEGQFFTPQNAINALVTLVAPVAGERFIDPACGAGGFLNAIARYLSKSGVSTDEIGDCIYGIDKDSYLVKLASARLSLITLSKAKVYCADSLAWMTEERRKFALQASIGTFDGVITNPPFGSKIVSVLPDVQESFDLGHKWKLDKDTGLFNKSSVLHKSVPPQVLFIERCLSLVKPGGRVGMVVPESLVSSKNYRYVVNYIREHAELQAVVGMPESLFKISGKGGTHTKTCLIVFHKRNERQDKNSHSKVFMSEVKWCGHDSRGRQIEKDELPLVSKNFQLFRQNNLSVPSHLGYEIFESNIKDNILAPRYYNPEVEECLLNLRRTHDLVKFGELVNSGLIEISTGDEVGKIAYGTGNIPFVRTSDISNWEVKIDPKHGVSEDIYNSYAKKQDVQEGDILMVRDGTYLIGTCAFITKYDTQIIYQSHLYKIRIKDTEELSPYLLLAALSSAPVQQQIKAKRFTQDIIDSLGDRIHELILPIPKNTKLSRQIIDTVRKSIEDRIEARELARKACVEIVSIE